MSTQQAIDYLGKDAAAAENPIAYTEAKATKEFFRKITDHCKKYFPDHDMWKNQEMKSYNFKEATITTIKGSIVAVIGR